MNERIVLLVPKGEIEEVTSNTLSDSGLEYDFVGERLSADVVNFPLTLVKVRPSSIPYLLTRDDTNARVGITGGDITWQAGLGVDAGIEFPAYEIYPEQSQPKLYLGITDSFIQNGAYTESRYESDGKSDVIPEDLSGYTIFSKYDQIAADYFSRRNIDGVEIVYEAGGIEGMQYIFDNTAGVIDIWNTGKTATANNIEPIDFFYNVSLRMITGNLTRFEQAIVDDLLEMVTIFKNRTQAATSGYM